MPYVHIAIPEVFSGNLGTLPTLSRSFRMAIRLSPSWLKWLSHAGQLGTWNKRGLKVTGKWWWNNDETPCPFKERRLINGRGHYTFQVLRKRHRHIAHKTKTLFKAKLQGNSGLASRISDHVVEEPDFDAMHSDSPALLGILSKPRVAENRRGFRCWWAMLKFVHQTLLE